MFKPVQSLEFTAATKSVIFRRMPTTYCNPLPIPNYPVGRQARDVLGGAQIVSAGMWLSETKQQFRELADPSVLWYEGRWYLYPSVDMAWVSEDGGASWRHHPLNVRDLGYAPTIVRHRNQFLLLASLSSVYTSDHPLGPFKELGKIPLPENVPENVDPMLFSDQDGRLFFYWGCTATEGIWGVELDADDPTLPVGKPVQLIAFEPDTHVWQCRGEWNQDPNTSWIEGAWMFKRGDAYYLTYSAAGTENRTYAMGCGVGSSPLGPFVSQKRNPILLATYGLVTGTAHGCIVEGPGTSLWAFYTVRAGVVHGFERRIGMDPAGIDAHGELYVNGPTSTPQCVATANAPSRNAGWVPLNVGVRTIASSSAGDLSARLAVDEDLRTFWQPAEEDHLPTLTAMLLAPAIIHAVRVVWRDNGMDTNRGIFAGPFRYRVEVEAAGGSWQTLIDRSTSDEDFLIDYRECFPTRANNVRLVIVGWPDRIRPAVAEFTVFGNTVRNAK